jgi:3',5'-cyclic AMP phosphodiesterase CpdA
MALNEADPPKDLTLTTENYTLLVASDLHLSDNEKAMDGFFAQVAAQKPAAVIYNGDLYNGREEFANMAQRLLEEKTGAPHYYVAGNHDQYFGWPVFMERFGSSTYTFVINAGAAQDLVIILESGSSTLGKEQLAWLKEQLKKRENYRHCLIFTHSNLVIHSFNFGTYPEDELHELYALFHEYKVSAVISGHSHVSDSKEILDVHYFNTAAAKNKHYGILTVNNELDFKPADF